MCVYSNLNLDCITLCSFICAAEVEAYVSIACIGLCCGCYNILLCCSSCCNILCGCCAFAALNNDLHCLELESAVLGNVSASCLNHAGRIVVLTCGVGIVVTVLDIVSTGSNRRRNSYVEYEEREVCGLVTCPLVFLTAVCP